MSQDIDSHKLIYHPERVVEWKNTGDSYPIYVEIGPTNRCNHHCIFCALDWIKKGAQDINSEILLSSLKDMGSNRVKSLMFAGEGEPLLHQDITTFVQAAKKANIDVSITTNGSLLSMQKSEEILPYLSWIRFSVDAATPKTYSKIHGVKKIAEFEKVIRNIECAVRIKKENKYDVVIGIQNLLISENIDEIIGLTKMAKAMGVDNMQIKPYSYHPLSKNNLSCNYEKLKDLEQKLSELDDGQFRVFYRGETIKRIKEGRTYDACHGLSFFALIDSKANVLPCNLFYDNPEYVYGNLQDASFSEIWYSERRKNVLKAIQANGLKSCRAACRLDPINRYLHRLKNPWPHDNFL